MFELLTELRAASLQGHRKIRFLLGVDGPDSAIGRDNLPPNDALVKT